MEFDTYMKHIAEIKNRKYGMPLFYESPCTP